MKCLKLSRVINIVLILFSVTLLEVKSQEIEIIFPTKGAVDVTTTPTINLKINGGYEIDSTCLNPNNPNRDNITYDSVNNVFSKAIINLFLEVLNDGSDSSRFVASYAGSYGYGGYSDSVNYSISLDSKLRNNFEYGLEIKSLKVYNPSTSDTVIIDTIINNYFTTIAPPVDLMYTNIENTIGLRCNDSLFVALTAPISNCSPGGNDILTLSSIVFNHDSLGNNLNITLDTISGNCSLSDDGMKIYFKSTDVLSYDNEYVLNINLENYTADTNQNYQLQFNINKQVELNISSFSSDSSMPSTVSPYLDNNKYFINKGDSLELYTEKVIGDFEFVRWELVGFPIAQGSPLVSDSSLKKAKLKFDCETPSNLDLLAIYKKIPIDTLELDTIVNNVGVVVGNYTVYNYLDSLSPYKYTFKSKGALNPLSVCANINSGYSFEGWSGDSELSEKLTQCLTIENNKNTRISNNPAGGGVVTPNEITACTNLNLSIEIHGLAYPFGTAGVHTFLQSFSLYANGNTIPVTFTKSSDYLSVANVVIPIGSFSNYEAVISAIPNDCMSIPYYEVTKSTNITSRVGDWKRGSELIQIINNTIIWDEKTSGCNAKIVLLLTGKKRYLDLSLQEKDGGILPSKKGILGFKMYDDVFEEFPYYAGASKLSVVRNANDEIIEWNYEMALTCDETYYISPQIFNDKSGYSLDSWESSTGYTSTPIISSLSPLSLELNMTTDRESIFYFKKGFSLDKIAVYYPGYDNSKDKYKLSNHKVYTALSGFPNTSIPSAPLHNVGVIPVYPGGDIYFREADFRFYFSEKIKENSIYSGGIIVHDKSGIIKENKLIRWDGRYEIDNYVGANSTEDKSISIVNDYTGFGAVNEYVAFKTRDKNNISTTHYNELGMQFTEKLETIYDEPLFTVYGKNSISFLTQSPNLIIKFESIYFDDTDETNAEYKAMFYGAYEEPIGYLNGTAIWNPSSSNVADISASTQMPGGSSYKEINSPNRTWDISSSPNMISVTNIGNGGWVEFGYDITEIDNCKVCGSYLSVIGKVADDMVGVLPENWNIPLKLTTSIAEHLDWNYLNPDQDDHWAEGGEVYKRVDKLWGTGNKMYKEISRLIRTETPKKNTLTIKLILRD